jgi:hydroxymethylglutaryl-CoA synthase
MDVHVAAVGAAAGALRLQRSDVAVAWGARGGRGSVAVTAADEDALTLAWDAATRALAVTGLSPSSVDGLWWGTTSPPFADGPSHAYLAAALGLPEYAGGALLTGSPHAGMDALLGAWDAVAAGSARTALVVASEAPSPGLGSAHERAAGAGAAALLLTVRPGPAKLMHRRTQARPVLDRYRGSAERDVRDLYDARLAREQILAPQIGAIIDAMEACGDVTTWSLADLDGRTAAALAAQRDAPDAAAGVVALVGETGTAGPLLGALGALGTVGTVAPIAYGGGRATGVSIVVREPVPGAGAIGDALAGGRMVTYPEALRARGVLTASGDPVPMGVPPTSAAFVRGNGELLAFLGARCIDCGVISTPPSLHPTCINCGGAKLEPVPLARTGTVHTFVVNQAMPPPFVAPLPIAIVDLDDGARVKVQVVGDGSDLAVGCQVRMVLRRYALERGAPVYGFKAEVA